MGIKIPQEIIKKSHNKQVLSSVRMTEEDKKFLDENNISPTYLFNWAIEQIKINGGVNIR